MGGIVCFMGKSSTGKDTIFRSLLEDKELKLQKLVPYTTRPIRDGEMNGVEYFFTDEEGYRRLLESGDIIEERSYDTYYGLWRYFTVNDNRMDWEHKKYAVIGTLDAYNQLCVFFGRDKVLPVLIEVDDGIRLQRALDREKMQEHPRYQEMCRRFLADCEDFSEANINKAGIGKRFKNDDLESCIREIKSYIKEFI